jgi:flagellar protein FlaI
LVKPEDLLIKSLDEELEYFKPVAFSQLQLKKVPKSKDSGFNILGKIPKNLLQKISSAWKPPILKDINKKYELIKDFAYAHIYWDANENYLVYEIIEPKLTELEMEKYEKIKRILIDYLDFVPEFAKNQEEIEKYLESKLKEVIFRYSLEMIEAEYLKIKYFIFRDFIGLEKIEPLLRDLQIEDISCDGVNVPIYVYHRKFGSLKTNVVYTDPEELDNLVIKIAQKCGKHISVANPILDGNLPDGSRVSATYAPEKDISTKGSVFTIRKFTKDPLTIIDLMNYGTIPSIIGAYLWLIVEFRKSGLVSGGTATGKTSILTTISSFIEPNAKIITIEDTAELNLPHEHWLAKVSRIGYGKDGTGEVTLFDHLKVALRERPDWIIVGEVRGIEANVLFQAMATGHAGLATIHADSVEAVINRLTTPPISLPAGLLQHLNFVLIMVRTKVNGVDVRRIKELVEIVGINPKTGEPLINTLFRWVAAGDHYEFASDHSHIIGKISDERGIKEDEIWEEIMRRKFVLEWLKENNIRHYLEVGKYIKDYYKDPEKVLKMMNYDKV